MVSQFISEMKQKKEKLCGGKWSILYCFMLCFMLVRGVAGLGDGVWCICTYLLERSTPIFYCEEHDDSGLVLTTCELKKVHTFSSNLLTWRCEKCKKCECVNFHAFTLFTVPTPFGCISHHTFPPTQAIKQRHHGGSSASG